MMVVCSVGVESIMEIWVLDPSPSDGGQATPLEVMLPKNLRVVSMDVGEYHGCAAMSDNSFTVGVKITTGRSG